MLPNLQIKVSLKKIVIGLVVVMAVYGGNALRIAIEDYLVASFVTFK